MPRRLNLLLISVFLSAFSLGACSPSPPNQPTPTFEAPTADQTPTSVPSLAPTDMLEQPLMPEPTVDLAGYLVGEPIPFFQPEQAFTITYVGPEGWVIGSVDGESDHIFRRVTLDLWTDVTPPEAAPANGEDLKRAAGFFLGKENAWVAYTTGPGSGQTHVVIWSMVDRFPHVSWAPSVIQTRGSIAGVELYFLDESHGWSLITFDEGGMNKQYIALYATKDGGATWEFLFDPMEGSEVQSCGKTGFVFENSQQGWLTRACKGMYATVFIDRTTNGGLTWEKVTLPAPTSAPDLFLGEGYCDLISPHFFPPNDLVFVLDCLTQYNPAVHTMYLYSTTNGGSSWTMLPIPERDLYFITRFSAYSIDREIFKTENGALDWTHIRAVNWDGQFTFTNEDRAAAVVRNGDEIAYVESYDGLQTFFEGNPSVHPSQDSREEDG